MIEERERAASPGYQLAILVLCVLLFLPVLACRNRPDTPRSTTFVLHPRGGAIIGRQTVADIRHRDAVPFVVGIRNESGRVATIESIVAVVVDSQGR